MILFYLFIYLFWVKMYMNFVFWSCEKRNKKSVGTICQLSFKKRKEKDDSDWVREKKNGILMFYILFSFFFLIDLDTEDHHCQPWRRSRIWKPNKLESSIASLNSNRVSHPPPSHPQAEAERPPPSGWRRVSPLSSSPKASPSSPGSVSPPITTIRALNIGDSCSTPPVLNSCARALSW